MIDENKQPSALEITLTDAPRVYQETEEEDDDTVNSVGASDQPAMTHASQSAYRHHLPRKGQPGCRVIKRGILNRKRGGSKPRKATQDSGMISLISENPPLKIESQPKI